MNCKTCKYFKKNMHNPALGFCESDKIRPVLDEGYDECLTVCVANPFSKIMIIVGEKFGCIHFGAKI